MNKASLMAELFFSAFFMSDTRSAKIFLLDSGTWMSELRVPEMKIERIDLTSRKYMYKAIAFLQVCQPDLSWDMSS